MYITPRLRLLAAVDPKALERERKDINDHQRRTRLVAQLDTAKARLDFLERRYNQDPTHYNLRAIRNQKERLAYFERAAALQGITKGKDSTH